MAFGGGFRACRDGNSPSLRGHFGLIARFLLLAERDPRRGRGQPQQPLPLCCSLPAATPALDGDPEGLGSPGERGWGGLGLLLCHRTPLALWVVPWVPSRGDGGAANVTA